MLLDAILKTPAFVLLFFTIINSIHGSGYDGITFDKRSSPDDHHVIVIDDEPSQSSTSSRLTIPPDYLYRVYDVQSGRHHEPSSVRGYRDLSLNPRDLHPDGFSQWWSDYEAAPAPRTQREARKRALCKSNMVSKYYAMQHIADRSNGYKGAIYHQDENKVLYRNDLSPGTVEARFEASPRLMPTLRMGDGELLVMDHTYNDS